MTINSLYGFWHTFVLEKSPSGGPQADILAKIRSAGDGISHLLQSFMPCVALPARRHKERNMEHNCGRFMWDLGEAEIQVLL